MDHSIQYTFLLYVATHGRLHYMSSLNTLTARAHGVDELIYK